MKYSVEQRQYTFGNYTINIQYKAGVFFFEDESATGKSKLGKLFKQMMLDDIDVACYTYGDLIEYRLTLEEYLKNRKVSILLIDRYNLYPDKFHDTINNLVKSGCMVLVDLTNSDAYDDVNIDLDPEYENIKIDMQKFEFNVTLINEV